MGLRTGNFHSLLSKCSDFDWQSLTVAFMSTLLTKIDTFHQRVDSANVFQCIASFLNVKNRALQRKGASGAPDAAHLSIGRYFS